MTKKDLAINAIRNVHSNTHGTLEDVLSDLEELRDMVGELIEAIECDIKIESNE